MIFDNIAIPVPQCSRFVTFFLVQTSFTKQQQKNTTSKRLKNSIKYHLFKRGEKMQQFPRRKEFERIPS